MNILILTYQGGMAGSTLSVSYLAEGLALRGHNIFVGCRQQSLLYKKLDETSVNLVPLDFRSRTDIKTMRKIREIVKDYGIHIINAQSSLDRYVSIFAKRLYKLPVKLIHTRRQVSRSDGGRIHGLFYYKNTDKIIAVSNGVKDSLSGLGIPEKHIIVIHNGTPVEKYKSVSEEKVNKIKMELDISDEDFVIGCVSRKKRQEQILEALKYLNGRITVIFVGVEKRSLYEEIIKRNNLKAKIYFPGRVSPEEILNYYPLFDVHILPSVTEGLSQSILEAMALGIPNVATAAAGNLDLIRDGENGLLFEDGNLEELAHKIMLIRKNRNLTRKLIENGKQTALHDFSIENTIDRYEQFFLDLIRK